MQGPESEAESGMRRQSTANWLALLTCVLLCGAQMYAEEGATAAPTDSAPQRERPSGVESPEAWWAEAMKELFAGVELDVEQRGVIDAIVEQAAYDRERFDEARKAFAEARSRGDEERVGELLERLTEIRDTFRPQQRIDMMRDVLSEEQREAFDRNRRLREDRIRAQRWSRQ